MKMKMKMEMETHRLKRRYQADLRRPWPRLLAREGRVKAARRRCEVYGARSRCRSRPTPVHDLGDHGSAPCRFAPAARACHGS